MLKASLHDRICDRSYYKTDYVTETAQREEAYTTYRPVVETQYQTQRVIVQRPVTETQMQSQQYVVQRPVTETAYYTQNSVAYQPVTTVQNAVVDQGGYVAQAYYQPGDTRYQFALGARWLCQRSDRPVYVAVAVAWAGSLHFFGQYSTQVQYQPNYVSVAVPQTSYMPQLVQQQIPYQTTRYENQVVQQQVPVQVDPRRKSSCRTTGAVQVQKMEAVKKRELCLTVFNDL